MRCWVLDDHAQYNNMCDYRVLRLVVDLLIACMDAWHVCTSSRCIEALEVAFRFFGLASLLYCMVKACVPQIIISVDVTVALLTHQLQNVLRTGACTFGFNTNKVFVMKQIYWSVYLMRYLILLCTIIDNNYHYYRCSSCCQHYIPHYQYIEYRPVSQPLVDVLKRPLCCCSAASMNVCQRACTISSL